MIGQKTVLSCVLATGIFGFTHLDDPTTVESTPLSFATAPELAAYPATTTHSIVSAVIFTREEVREAQVELDWENAPDEAAKEVIEDGEEDYEDTDDPDPIGWLIENAELWSPSPYWP